MTKNDNVISIETPVNPLAQRLKKGHKHKWPPANTEVAFPTPLRSAKRGR